MYIVSKSKSYVKSIASFLAIILADISFSVLAGLQNIVHNKAIYNIISMLILKVSKGILAFWFVFIGYYSVLVLKNLRNRKALVIGSMLFTLNVFVSHLNLGVDLNSLDLGSSPLLFYICGIIGSFGTILLFKFFELYIHFRILSFCGKNSLILLATHLPIGLTAVAAFFFNKIITVSVGVSVAYFLECLAILLLLLAIEYFVIMLINKNMPFLIGKKSYKTGINRPEML